MYKYYAYGMCIQSDIRLPGFMPGSGLPDVQIRLDRLDDSVLAQKPNRERRFFGYIYDELAFLIEDGRNVTIDLRNGTRESDVWTYVSGVMMALLLRQRGFLTLHASCVAKDGNAIAFVGESGWGKSSLAQAFCSAGYALVNDDILAIQVTKRETPRVLPGYPQIRLWDDSGTFLRRDFSELPPVVPGEEKRLCSAEIVESGPAPLAGLFMLNPVYESANYVEILPHQTAFLRLLAHTRATHLLKADGDRARHLQQCGAIVERVPVFQLHRVSSLDRIDEIRAVVEDSLVPSTEI